MVIKTRWLEALFNIYIVGAFTDLGYKSYKRLGGVVSIVMSLFYGSDSR